MALRFPPHGGGGVQRTTYFVKYLEQVGWDCRVLTGPGTSHRLRDATLLSVLPDDLEVTRTGYWETRDIYRTLGRIRLATLARWLTPALPMMQPGWIPHAVRAGRKILESEDIDVIYSTAYPVSAHVVAYLLGREFGLPWVADFRDTWSTREILHWPTPLHRRLARSLERRILEATDRVVTTSPAATEDFLRAHPSVPAGRYELITNGFEEAEVDAPRPVPEVLALDRGRRFTITHVGLVSESRRPDGLMAALDRLLDDGSIPEDRIRINFVGQTGDLGAGDLEDRGVVRRIPYVEHERALAWMKHSDVLLLLNGEPVNIPGKLFEYLGVGRPVLAVMPSGPASRIIEGAGAGISHEPDDTAGLVGAIRHLYCRWKDDDLPPGNREALRTYTRPETARRLAGVLDDVTGRSGAQYGRDGSADPSFRGDLQQSEHDCAIS